MTEPTPATGANKVLKQWRWILVAIGIVTLAVVSGRGDVQPAGGFDPADDVRCTLEVTADVLNVRAGPGTEHATVDQLSRGEVVDGQPEVSGAFRKLADGGWVASEFVRPSTGCG